VADVDRAFVADRLKTAIDEGRLSLGEYDERLRDTYAARTYGDLDRLLHDLPGGVPPGPVTGAVQPVSTGHEPAATSDGASPAQVPALALRASMPRWLAAVWGAWTVAVTVNVVIWALVSLSADGGPVYFWPMWVAGPWGAVLLATTLTGLAAGVPFRSEDHARRIELIRQRRDQRVEQAQRRRDRYAAQADLRDQRRAWKAQWRDERHQRRRARRGC
jgi:hypothetical protein